MGLEHLTSQPLKNSSKQERKINRQATTKYLKNKGMRTNYQNGSMLPLLNHLTDPIISYHQINLS